MSYIRKQIEFAIGEYPGSEREVEAFAAGIQEGFEIALHTFGVWKNGTQVIGCQDKRVVEIIQEEFGGTPPQNASEEKK